MPRKLKLFAQDAHMGTSTTAAHRSTPLSGSQESHLTSTTMQCWQHERWGSASVRWCACLPCSTSRVAFTIGHTTGSTARFTTSCSMAQRQTHSLHHTPLCTRCMMISIAVQMDHGTLPSAMMGLGTSKDTRHLWEHAS